MNDDLPATARRKRNATAWVVIVLAGGAGFKLAYDFGFALNGRWLAWLTGLNGALLCSLLADAALDRVDRWRSGRGAPRP